MIVRRILEPIALGALWLWMTVMALGALGAIIVALGTIARIW